MSSVLLSGVVEGWYSESDSESRSDCRLRGPLLFCAVVFLLLSTYFPLPSGAVTAHITFTNFSTFILLHKSPTWTAAAALYHYREVETQKNLKHFTRLPSLLEDEAAAFRAFGAFRRVFVRAALLARVVIGSAVTPSLLEDEAAAFRAFGAFRRVFVRAALLARVVIGSAFT